MTKLIRRTVRVIAPIHRAITSIIKYEHLPYMCFQCDQIGHTTKQCPLGKKDLSEEEKQSLQYGNWLYANNCKSHLLSYFCAMLEMEVDLTDIVDQVRKRDKTEQEVSSLGTKIHPINKPRKAKFDISKEMVKGQEVAEPLETLTRVILRTNKGLKREGKVSMKGIAGEKH